MSKKTIRFLLLAMFALISEQWSFCESIKFDLMLMMDMNGFREINYINVLKDALKQIPNMYKMSDDGVRLGLWTCSAAKSAVKLAFTGDRQRFIEHVDRLEYRMDEAATCDQLLNDVQQSFEKHNRPGVGRFLVLITDDMPISMIDAIKYINKVEMESRGYVMIVYIGDTDESTLNGMRELVGENVFNLSLSTDNEQLRFVMEKIQHKIQLLVCKLYDFACVYTNQTDCQPIRVMPGVCGNITLYGQACHSGTMCKYYCDRWAVPGDLRDCLCNERVTRIYPEEWSSLTRYCPPVVCDSSTCVEQDSLSSSSSSSFDPENEVNSSEVAPSVTSDRQLLVVDPNAMLSPKFGLGHAKPSTTTVRQTKIKGQTAKSSAKTGSENNRNKSKSVPAAAIQPGYRIESRESEKTYGQSGTGFMSALVMLIVLLLVLALISALVILYRRQQQIHDEVEQRLDEIAAREQPVSPMVCIVSESPASKKLSVRHHSSKSHSSRKQQSPVEQSKSLRSLKFPAKSDKNVGVSLRSDKSKSSKNCSSRSSISSKTPQKISASTP